MSGEYKNLTGASDEYKRGYSEGYCNGRLRGFNEQTLDNAERVITKNSLASLVIYASSVDENGVVDMSGNCTGNPNNVQYLLYQLIQIVRNIIGDESDYESFCEALTRFSDSDSVLMWGRDYGQL